jgi:hypothetical protein
VLISIGEESENTSIKIWRLDKFDNDGVPICVRTLKIFSSKFPPVPVTSFSILEDLSQVAIGLGNGAVMLFNGNIMRDSSCKQSLLQREGKIVTSKQKEYIHNEMKYII